MNTTKKVTINSVNSMPGRGRTWLLRIVLKLAVNVISSNLLGGVLFLFFITHRSLLGSALRGSPSLSVVTSAGLVEALHSNTGIVSVIHSPSTTGSQAAYS